jgi:hypothetical protein
LIVAGYPRKVIEIEVGFSDCIDAFLATPDDDAQDIEFHRLAERAHAALCRVPDRTIAGLSKDKRGVFYAALLHQANRFKEPAP